MELTTQNTRLVVNVLTILHIGIFTNNFAGRNGQQRKALRKGQLIGQLSKPVPKGPRSGQVGPQRHGIIIP